ncbi:MAG: iron-siderophore ABC transporter substrate-binding protein, partial [Chloroflexota bacterium]
IKFTFYELRNLMRRYSLIMLISLLITSMTSTAQSDSCDDGFRLIEHALGEACAPIEPQRIVSFDMSITELLLIADMPPVATSHTVLDAHTRMHPELESTFSELMDTTPDAGFPPNIEVILEAEPDLIIAPSDFFTRLLYPQLSDIAPTIIYELTPGDWQTRLVFAGDILGLSETVSDLLEQYDERVNELHPLLDDIDAPAISLVRTFPGQIGLVLEGTAAASLLSELDIPRPEAQSFDYQYVLDELDGRPELIISIEEMQLADGDIIFVFGDSTELVEMPVWNALSAVQNDRAYEVGYYWWGDSLLSAHDMLDDLFTYVVEAEPEIINPFAEGFILSPEATEQP